MFGRLFSISRAYVNHHVRKRRTSGSSNTYDQSGADTTYREEASYRTRDASSATGSGSTSNPYGLPEQVLDDLALFEITPPGSWNEVVQARNREMKKYHPDKYMNASEKIAAANEIAQIYNAAFERLKTHFHR